MDKERIPLVKGQIQYQLPGDINDDPAVKVVRVEGYRTTKLSFTIFVFVCIITAGFFLITLKWAPKTALLTRKRRCNFNVADCVLIQRADGSFEEIPVLTPSAPEDFDKFKMYDTMKIIEYRCLRYYYDGETGSFERVRFDVKLPYDRVHERLGNGNSVSELPTLRHRFGLNAIHVPIQSYPSLFFKEALHPFYIFQVFSITLWMLDDYRIYATCIAVTSIGSALSNVVQLKKNMENLRSMAAIQCVMPVIRSKNVTVVDSQQLFPGDLVEIRDGTTLPCDLVVLAGSCIVNESMLTGESVPILKSHLPHHDEGTGDYDPDTDTKYTLYCGTTVIQAKGSKQHVTCQAVVVNTGYNTAKGRMIRDMLYPKPTKFSFYRDSFRFLLALFGVAMIGFAFSVYQFIHLHAEPFEIVKRSMDLITIVVPPALPLALTIGVMAAIGRLRKSDIYCISPQRVNEAGKIKCICFDKTGTLTADGLDVLGARPTDNGKFMPMNSDITTVPPRLLSILAACHTLSDVQGKLIGEPLELKMFSATRWIYTESPVGQDDLLAIVHPPNAHPRHLGILRRFQFSSALQRMSVLIRNNATGAIEFFVKGSPEVVTSLSNRGTIPLEYAQVLHDYTTQGYRVLACASATLPAQMSIQEAVKLSRESLEQNLTFMGLLVMNNPLKEESPPTIQRLTNAKIRSVMVTGDNIRTAISVARGCGIIDPAARVFIADPATPGPNVKWVAAENESQVFDSETVLKTPGSRLAMTGKAFDSFMNGDGEIFDALVNKCDVFSRMAPEQKAQVVEMFDHLGYVSAFCGDGSNDCSALKAARVGLSLSEAEASIAAPFTSKIQNVSPMITLIREGRCALVTSFQLFKYMALYSLIQFVSVIVLYRIGSTLGDWQFLFIDLGVIIPLALGMSGVGAYGKLVAQKPTANLMHRTVLASVVGQIIIQILCILGMFFLLTEMSWYEPFRPIDFKNKDANVKCTENSMVFLFTNFQYIIVILAFCNNKPFRKPFYSSWFLTTCIVALICACIYLVIWPAPFFVDLFKLVDLPFKFRLYILIGVVINGAASWMYERVVIGWLLRLKFGSKNKSKKLCKQLELKYL